MGDLITAGEMERIKLANGNLAEVIERNMKQAYEKVLGLARGKPWDDDNLHALMAFEAMRSAEEERHNLRSMQAWLAVKVAKHKLYLAFPPLPEHPDGFGSMVEWLKAVGISGTTVYALNDLSTEVAPLLEDHGYEVERYLNRDRFPKLAEAVSKLKYIARGEETDYDIEEVMQDVEKAQSRDDIRLKYRKQEFIAEGAINSLGTQKTLTIIVDEEHTQTLLNTLRSKVDWHTRTAVAEEKEHEVVIHFMKQ